MVADYFVTRAKQASKDGINDKFRDTIVDDYGYGNLSKSNPDRRNLYTQNTAPFFKGSGEKQKAFDNKITKPSKRLNARGQDSVTRDREHMSTRNPDGSKRIIPKNKSDRVRPL